MRRKRLALAALPLAAGLQLTSCAEAVSDAYVVEHDPGKVEHVDGSEIGRVILEVGAEERLGLQTAAVWRQGTDRAVSDAAVFVDPEGTWWVYTNPEPGVFVRREVTLESQHDGVAVFSSGPRPGTQVVTTGVAELYGIESEVGH